MYNIRFIRIAKAISNTWNVRSEKRFQLAYNQIVVMGICDDKVNGIQL